MSTRIEQLKLLLSLFMSAALCACQEPPMTPIQADDSIRVPPLVDMEAAPDMLSIEEDQMPPLAGLDDQGPPEPPPPLYPAGWIELELSPARVFFTFSESPTVVATVYNVYGEVIEGAEVSFELMGAVGELTVEGPLSERHLHTRWRRVDQRVHWRGGRRGSEWRASVCAPRVAR